MQKNEQRKCKTAYAMALPKPAAHNCSTTATVKNPPPKPAAPATKVRLTTALCWSAVGMSATLCAIVCQSIIVVKRLICGQA